MEQVGWAVLSLAIGLGTAVQIGMMAAVGRRRGPLEGAYLSTVVTTGGSAVALLVVQAGVGSLELPGPLRDPWLPLAIVAVSTFTAVAGMRGITWHLGTMVFIWLSFMLLAPIIIPEAGVALFVAATTAGSLAGGLVLDHRGTFGSEVRLFNGQRLVGVALLMSGVALIAA